MTNWSVSDIVDGSSRWGVDGTTRPTPDGYLLTATNPRRNADYQQSQAVRRAVDAEDLAQGVADLADGGHPPQRLAHRHQQVVLAVTAARGVAQLLEGGPHRPVVALGAYLGERLGLRLREGRVELEQAHRLLLATGVAVDAHHHPGARLDRFELIIG